MELQWIGVAFILGLVARRLGQPPLLGFLLAGFALELFGLRPDLALRELADLGVLLLLFAIGLKLDLRSLVRPFVAGVAAAHMTLFAGLIAALLFAAAPALAALGLAPLDWGQAAVVGFAASFSSTVYAVKLFESRDDTAALYGRTAVGILIIQDIAAVVFLAATKGAWPSPWALALLGLPALRPLVGHVLELAGHRELLLLAGLAAAMGGAALFELVGLKADLGALVAGLLCAGHAKSEELAKSFIALKDVFLVGFFLTIGLAGLPTSGTFLLALLLCVLLPLKGVLFLLLATRFGLRARTSLLVSTSLSNYSEFGLIVATVAAAAGWLPEAWVVVLALATGLSFLYATLLDSRAFELYRRQRDRLQRLERAERVQEEEPVLVEDAEVLVFGMGRVGVRAFDAVRERIGERVVAFDVDNRVVHDQREAGRRIIEASATDADFWRRLHVERDRVRLILLAMSSHEENRVAIEQLRAEGFRGAVAATARYEDEVESLRELGADLVFHVLADAGAAFAESSLEVAGIPTSDPAPAPPTGAEG